MNINDLKNLIKIKWNSFDMVLVNSSWDLTTKFDINPYDFLEFAKSDYRNKDKKGMVDALSNSKRSIDCQVDWIISYLGYDYLNFSERRYPEIRTLINEFEENVDAYKDLSLKLRFIQSLELTSVFLISKIRTLRNKLEHQYMLPSNDEVREAIEVAEIFINATQNIILNKFSNDCYFGNRYNEDTGTWITPYLEISFNPFNKHNNSFNISVRSDKENISGLNIRDSIELQAIDKGYVYIIKALITQDFSYLVKVFGDKVDKKYVNYTFKVY